MRKFFLILAFSLPFFSCKEKKASTTQQQAGNANTANPPPMAVEAMIAKASSINNKIEVPGSIMAFETTDLHPEISGRIVQLNIKESVFVPKGALLAKLYDGDLQAQLKKLQVQLDIAKTNEQRSAQLLKIQGISKADYDASALNVSNINADIAITRANITKTEIRAPFSGRLGLKNVSPGAFVTPSTVLTTISQVNQLKLQFSVPEKYGSQVKNGQSIAFTVDGSSKTFFASVIASEASIEADTRSLTVRALIKGNDAALIPGSFAKVQIELSKEENAIMIPTSAVVPQGRKKQVFLFKTGKALASDITTGIRDSANIQVLTGLNLGDTVITSGLLFLRPGNDVKISKMN